MFGEILIGHIQELQFIQCAHQILFTGHVASRLCGWFSDTGKAINSLGAYSIEFEERHHDSFMSVRFWKADFLWRMAINRFACTVLYPTGFFGTKSRFISAVSTPSTLVGISVCLLRSSSLLTRTVSSQRECNTLSGSKNSIWLENFNNWKFVSRYLSNVSPRQKAHGFWKTLFLSFENVSFHLIYVVGIT